MPIRSAFSGKMTEAGQKRERADPAAIEAMASRAEAFPSVEGAHYGPHISRLGDPRVVLLGESTHGTSEFYRMRAQITRRLIEQKGVRIVALEADWPDAARIDAWVRGLRQEAQSWRAFSRFPTWMWRNREFREFVDWLHDFNAKRPPTDRVAVRGLDLYSMDQSAHAVVHHLEQVDPQAAQVARERYGCFMAFPQETEDVAGVGGAAARGAYADCEDEVVAMLEEILEKDRSRWSPDGDRFLDLVQNARLVKNAESYYRAMYEGGRKAWNTRDGHMYEALEALLEEAGEDSKAVVWAHNSHVGDARATQMRERGELNIGQLCRQGLGEDCRLVGFLTHTGTVAAADRWDGPVKTKRVRPSHPRSHERVAHETGLPGFFLPFEEGDPLPSELMESRLERAIGVVYRPDTEIFSHYFQAVLPRQFDELVWLDETRAVSPLQAQELEGVPETYPFGV